MPPPKHRFFAPPESIQDGRALLPEDEARHAAKVLRLGVGDRIVVVDGAGGEYEVILTHVGKDRVEGGVQVERRDAGESPGHLTVGLALLKNASRFQTFLEKAVELGVSRIIPLETTRSERSRIKESRAQMILRSALKQCGRSRLPALDPVTRLDQVLSAENQPGTMRLLCHEETNAASHITRMMGQETRSVQVLIGPEGGFTGDEVRMAVDNGWLLTGLGNRRLRAETAALAAAAFASLQLDASFMNRP